MSDIKSDFDRSELVAIDTSKRVYTEDHRYAGKHIYKISDSVFGPSEFFEMWDVMSVEKHSQDKIHVVGPEDKYRIDLIAQFYYGNWLFWWVIAVANGIFDPIQEITEGLVLRIPYLGTIYKRLRW